MKTLNLTVDGMMCGGCSARLQRVLEALPQVESCKADHVTKAVELVLKEDLPFAIRQPGKIWSIRDNIPSVICGSGMLRILEAEQEDGTPVLFSKLRCRLGKRSDAGQ